MEKDFDLRPLREDEIRNMLLDLPGWNYGDNKIEKTFVFSSFDKGIELIVGLAPFCDEIDHHPDILIEYKKVKFSLTRFSIGGKVCERDFTVARRIEELFSKRE